MTREEIKEIEQYCAEHGMTFKHRLNELNIPESNFYYARRMYSREDMVPSSGEFVQLSPSGMLFPMAQASVNIKRKVKQAQQAESYMTVEFRSEGGVAMRIQGNMTAEHLQAIMTGIR